MADAILPRDTFWQRMEYARIKKGYSCRELETLMRLGRGYYGNFEKVGMGMKAETLARFCELTGVTVSFIVYGENPPYPMIGLAADTIGGRIRELRERYGLSQREFAVRIGYDRETGIVRLWEKDRHAIRVENLVRIAEGCCVSVESLISGYYFKY